MTSETHIVPLLVGCPAQARQMTDLLMQKHGIYVQPINYPTVPRGTERLRITPSPFHDDQLMEDAVAAISDVWSQVAGKQPQAA